MEVDEDDNHRTMDESRNVLKCATKDRVERAYPMSGPDRAECTMDESQMARAFPMNGAGGVECGVQGGKIETEMLEQRERLLTTYTMLTIGATFNNTNILKRALVREDEHQFTDKALLISVKLGHCESVNLLVTYGANANTFDDEGTPCLLLAAELQFHDILKCLLNSKELRVNAADAHDNTALHLATLNNDVQTAKLLLTYGADPNLRNGDSETALIMASKRGSSSMISVLLSGFADPYITKFNERTAFHIAVECGHFDCVQEFISHNIDIHHYDLDGRCALHMASRKGYLGIVRMLIGAGAPVNVLDHARKTPVYEAVTGGGHINVVALLLTSGALTEWDIQTIYGLNCPILCAIYYGHVDILRLLLTFNCNVNRAKYRNMTTALHCTALHGQVQCTKLLLTAGADPNIQCDRGYSPAHVVSQSTRHSSISIQTLRLLLHINADFEITSGSTCIPTGVRARPATPFQLALHTGQMDIACWLALAGVDMNLTQEIIYHVFPSMKPFSTAILESRPIVKWLLEKASNPKSLMELSRLAIRKRMGLRIVDRVGGTGLPQILHKYVIHEEMCENSDYWFCAKNVIIKKNNTDV